jgi:8-oxo-dGTP pyrophosphatase MutT (NUDIX family)
MRQLAVGLCVRPSDGALLVEQGEDRVTGARFLRAIGGGIEPGEAPEDAVVREWREELGLAVRVVRRLGTLDNRFVHEGRPGREHVTVFEVVPEDPAVYAAARLEGHDELGAPHVAVWHPRDAAAPPLYPVGLLALLRPADA